MLDELYLQILDEAFGNTHDEDIRHRRLQILHTFLSTAERTSENLVATLLSTSNDHRSYMQGAATVLKALHAVLYVEGGRVLSYHKSFSDFLFNQTRSQKFWCDQEAHHRLLTDSCFRLMFSQLKFNIANIPSSFILDRDNAILQREIERTISPALAYSCRQWSYHMCAASWVDHAHLVKTLKEFFQIRALFWIEVMNLLQCLGQCDGMLQAATNLFREVGIISVMTISILTRSPFRLTRGWRDIAPKPRILLCTSAGVLLPCPPHTCTFRRWRHGQGVYILANGGRLSSRGFRPLQCGGVAAYY